MAAQSQRSGEDQKALLEKANKAIHGLKKSHLTELKSLANPPQLVKTVMESICVLLGIKPKLVGPKREPDYWQASKALLASTDTFSERLKDLDKDHISPKIMQRLRNEYITRPDFNPCNAKNVSMACAGLCTFVLTVEEYDRDVPPKLMGLSKHPDYWRASQALLASPDFLKRLAGLDKDRIPPQIMHTLRTEYTTRPDFNPECVRRVSFACAGLCTFVLMVEEHDRENVQFSSQRADPTL